MTPSVIFPSLSLFSLLRFPVMFYPRCLALVRGRARRASTRLQKYFLHARGIARHDGVAASARGRGCAREDDE